MFAKVRLSPFHCPHCKAVRKYSLLELHSWHPRYLCENCDSVFVATNLSLLGMGYGAVVGVIGALIASGPIYAFYVRTGITIGWLRLGMFLISVPVCWFLWAVFVARLIHFKYVGRIET